jgi:ankyrin repeat protein
MDAFELIRNDDTAALKAALAADPATARQANAEGASLLSFAVYWGRQDAADAIRAALPELTPHEAIIVGDEAAVRAALANGWDAEALAPDGFPPLALAAFFGHDALFDLLLPVTRDLNRRAKNGQQVAAIHAAAASRNNAMVEKLLRAGADPNLVQQDGFTALHAVAQQGDAQMAGLLLLAGADPAAQTAGGKTAAEIAREKGHDWLAEKLAG